MPPVIPIPVDDAERVATLRALNILDTSREERFDRLTRLAAQVLDVPIAYVALVDENRQWIKSCQGTDLPEMPREESFCAFTIAQPDMLVIEDALADPRFADNRMVVNPPNVRFYAGYPLKAGAGHNVGTLCIMDRAPRSLTPAHRDVLRALATVAERELELVDVITLQGDLLATKNRLIETQRQMAAELEAASQYVRALLPGRLTGSISAESRWYPSALLGGDTFDYLWLDDDRFVIHLIDVTDHGIRPALLSVSIGNILRSQALPGVDFTHPAQVLHALNQRFQMEHHDQLCFSIWYGVFDRRTRMLRFASGGHPPAILLSRQPGSTPPLALSGRGCMLGAMPDMPFAEVEQIVPEKSSLYVFSDGVYEVGDRVLPFSEFIGMIGEMSADRDPDLDEILRASKGRACCDRFDDDVAIIRVTF